ncbi:MAG: helix-turn-helix domain-containing protein [Phenylobacterium sp.]|nr:helix-turn-helix domain-containing protein [Phenylobacterium sp.]
MSSPSVFISTEQVAPELRDEFWRQVAGPVFEPRPIGEDQTIGLEGSVGSRPVGGLLIGPTTFNAQRNVRGRRLIAVGGLDQYMVQLFLKGEARGESDGYEYRAARGDICIRDLARPFDTSVSPGGTISMLIPRERLESRLGGHVLHACVLTARDPMTRLLADFIVSLSDVAAELAPADALALEDAAVDLVAAVVMRRSPGLAVETPVAGRVLRPRVLAFIDRNLFEPALGPKMLVERFGVSRAHLYRMFEADGGVASVIRNRRLDAALRELAGPARRSITALALHLGFSSSSQFARAFRARFDCTPSEVAGGAAPPLADGLGDLRRHFAGHAP